jgi:hypothetical protein
MTSLAKQITKKPSNNIKIHIRENSIYRTLSEPVLGNSDHFVIKMIDPDEPQENPDRLIVSNYEISTIRKNLKDYDISFVNLRGHLYYNGLNFNIGYLFLRSRDKTLNKIQKICIVNEDGSVFDYDKKNYKFVVI